MSTNAERLSLSEPLENTELTPTPSSDSESDAVMPLVTRGATNEVGGQKDATTVAMSKFNPKDDIKTAIKVEIDSEKHQPIATPVTPEKKRAASKYPTPPPTKKIRVTIKCIRENAPEAAEINDTNPKLRRHNKTLRIIIPKRQDTYKSSPVEDHEVLTPEGPWAEKRLGLLSPQSIPPTPLPCSSAETESPHTVEDDLHHDREDLLPDAPADNSRKVLSLHPARTGIRWVGELSERKLAKELEKYERVKGFWLCNDGHAHCPGWDCKHEFVAHEFAEEVQSPWVLAWLAELIGRSDVYLILDNLERRMRGEFEGFEGVEEVEEVEGADG